MDSLKTFQYQCLNKQKILVQEFNVPLLFPDLIDDASLESVISPNIPGKLPVLRKRLKHTTYKASVLCVHGLASNRYVFDAGSGRGGRSRYSFMEYLACSGYDVWALDLRGTRDSIRLGCKRPKGIREYAEKDVPSVLAFMLSVINAEKILLIGHSMGAAVCCAVAGHSPHSIMGVVQLAGLYNLTFTPFSLASGVFQQIVPSILQQPLGVAVKLCSSLVLGSIGELIRLWDDREYMQNWSRAQPLAVAESETSKSALLKFLEQQEFQIAKFKRLSGGSLNLLMRSITQLRRMPIPMRLACDVFLTSVPLQKLFNLDRPCIELLGQLNSLAPWAPNSIEDPWQFMNLTVESPTLGLFMDIMCWHGSLMPFEGTDGGADDSLVLLDEIHSSNRTANPLDLHLRSFERHPDLPMFFVAANNDKVIRNSDSHAGYTRACSRNKHILEYVEKPFSISQFDSCNFADDRRDSRVDLSNSNDILTQIEYPKLSCFGNLTAATSFDSAAKSTNYPGFSVQNNVMTYIETTSIQKTGDPIVNTEPARREPETPILSIVESSIPIISISPDFDIGSSETKLEGDQHYDCGYQDCNKTNVPSLNGIYSAFKRMLESSVPRLFGFNSSSSPKTKHLQHSPPVSLPASPCISSQDPRFSETEFAKYTVHDHTSYGHCDILGGKNAEKIWAQVVKWMDDICIMNS